MPLRAIAFEAILSANCSTRAYPRGGDPSAIASGSCVRPRARTGGMERQPDRPRDWIPRRTVRDWRSGRVPDFDRVRRLSTLSSRNCAVCRGDPLSLPQGPYTYLLGLYLGDGCIA